MIVVDDHSDLARNVADDIRDFGNVGLRAPLKDNRERAVQALREQFGAVDAAGIWRHDDDLVVAQPFAL